MSDGEYVDMLVSEYAGLLCRRRSNHAHTRHDGASLVKTLAVSADWSVSGARELLRMTDRYGAFMLRNALAVAIALGKEDGTHGF